MSDEAERIRRQMRDLRQDMGHDVHGIVQGARELSDWHYYVRRHPWACLGGAFALGFLITPARKQLLRHADLSKLVEHLQASGVIPDKSSAAAAGPASGLLGAAASMAAPMIMRTVATLVAQKIAGRGQNQDTQAASPDATSYPAP